MLGVLGVLNFLNVHNVHNVLSMLMDASLACWALFTDVRCADRLTDRPKE